MKKTLIIFVLIILTGLAFAEPVKGRNQLPLIYSPDLLGASSIVNGDPPQSEIINPATAADRQRVILDLSYTGLIESAGNDSGLKGHAVNLGLTVPTRAVIINGSGHFFYSYLDNFAPGVGGAVYLSLAKDLYPNFLIGTGLHSTFGEEGFDILMDLGFIHKAGDLAFMKDFKWGASIRNLGYPIIPNDAPYSAPFTLSLGSGFNVVDKENFRWQVNADAHFPSFMNADFALGNSFTFAKVINFKTSFRFDVAGLAEGSGKPIFVPALELGFNFKTNLEGDSFLKEKGWNQSEIKPRVAVAPISNYKSAPYLGKDYAVSVGAVLPLGMIDKNPPRIETEQPEVMYFSPDHDGESDALLLPAEIKDERYIKGYKLTIRNSRGEVARVLRNKDERPESIRFKNILQQLAAVKKGIQMPEAFRWDGLTDSGEPAPDGEYNYQLEVWDDNQNVQKSQVYKAVLDTEDPNLEVKDLSLVERIFSPNNDGNKDQLAIPMDGSEEKQWSAVIYNNKQEPVRHYKWSQAKPQDFQWDGKDDDGNIVGDGVYSCKISSKDEAGNKVEKTVDNIIVNTEQTPVRITIDSSVFNNVKGKMELNVEVPVKRGIAQWKINILNQDDQIVRTLLGQGTPGEAPVYFDGKDDKGDGLAEGSYRAQLQVLYQNGNAPENESASFAVDRTDPEALVKPSEKIFSPNGDGNKDVVSFYQESSQEVKWTGEVIREDSGKIVRRFQWIEKADERVVWDGRDDEGRVVEDGAYLYQVKSVDKAGNKGGSKPVRVEVNTEETPVLLSVGAKAFSPNGDGSKDKIDIIPQLKNKTDVVSYTLTVLDKDNAPIKTYKGNNAPPASISWDGLSDSGKTLQDGPYWPNIKVVYNNGNTPEVRGPSFLLDTKAPEGELKADYQIFSPNEDGSKDNLPLQQKLSRDAEWKAEIRDDKGNVVRNVQWKEAPDQFSWDGKDGSGNRLPDGEYSYVLVGEDNAGNKTELKLDKISLDTKKTPLFVTKEADGFSPNGDEYADSINFNILAPNNNGIASWVASIINEAGESVWTLKGQETVPPSISWNGLNSSGAKLPEGKYKMDFLLIYSKGNRPRKQTPFFLLDVSGPKVDIKATPQPFSPDNDGVDDELNINIDIKEASGIKDWKLEILDPKGSSFISYSGEGSPAERFIWDGRSSEGELVQSAMDYPYQMTVTDKLGNTSMEKGIIPIDILVVRYGDQLKIKIANITFAPSSPSMITSDPEINRKNEQILDRLGQILRRYDSYQIKIEGHANSLKWRDPQAKAREEADILKPLSKKRAESVKQALTRRGIPAARVQTVGMGGTMPVVPFDDTENTWKNRRVEFILIK